MTNEKWVIARQPKDSIPIVGQVYEIRDSRKGTFTGRILSVAGEWATVERLEGDIHWGSTENKLFVGPRPKTLNIRAGLVYLIELNPSSARVLRQIEHYRN